MVERRRFVLSLIGSPSSHPCRPNGGQLMCLFLIVSEEVSLFCVWSHSKKIPLGGADFKPEVKARLCGERRLQKEDVPQLIGGSGCCWWSMLHAFSYFLAATGLHCPPLLPQRLGLTIISSLASTSCVTRAMARFQLLRKFPLHLFRCELKSEIRKWG